MTSDTMCALVAEGDGKPAVTSLRGGAAPRTPRPPSEMGDKGLEGHSPGRAGKPYSGTPGGQGAR